MDEDEQLPKEEVNQLIDDVYGGETHQRLLDLQSQEHTAEHKPATPPSSEPADQHPSHKELGPEDQSKSLTTR